MDSPSRSIRLTKKFIYEANHSPSGCNAIFLHNNAKVNRPKEFGLKVYRKFWDAIGAYQRQKLAAMRNAAPPVGQLIIFVSTTKKPYFGYETAVCNGFRYLGGLPDKLGDTLHEISITGMPVNDLRTGTSGVKAKLVKAKKSDGYRLGGDLHSENVAKWKGKLVCIDFGYHSVLDECLRYERAAKRL